MSSSERRIGRWSRRIAAAALLPFVGCASAPIRQYDLADQPLTCEEGNHLAYRTVEAMGYTVGAFEPATPGRDGTIRASRQARGSGEEQHMTVGIACGPGGVTLNASRDGVLVEQMDTKRGFHHAFLNVQAMGAAQQQLEAQMRAGTAPASQQRRDLRVVIAPLRGPGSKLEFPFDLAAAGILPVRVDITNLTPRTYRLAPDAIRLQRRDRTRVAPLAVSAAAAQVAAARVGGAPLTTMNTAAIADALAAHQFTATSIAPNGQQQGFLYFPLADYTSARAVLTDAESEEDEGVRVEF
ncbi:hypothetical protein KF840_13505 [bacterium]|nr:hypothetical protein [bacterium]